MRVSPRVLDKVTASVAASVEALAKGIDGVYRGTYTSKVNANDAARCCVEALEHVARFGSPQPPSVLLLQHSRLCAGAPGTVNCCVMTPS